MHPANGGTGRGHVQTWHAQTCHRHGLCHARAYRHAMRVRTDMPCACVRARAQVRIRQPVARIRQQAAGWAENANPASWNQHISTWAYDHMRPAQECAGARLLPVARGACLSARARTGEGRRSCKTFWIASGWIWKIPVPSGSCQATSCASPFPPRASLACGTW
jgi:hypothetical protein